MENMSGYEQVNVIINVAQPSFSCGLDKAWQYLVIIGYIGIPYYRSNPTQEKREGWVDKFSIKIKNELE